MTSRRKEIEIAKVLTQETIFNVKNQELKGHGTTEKQAALNPFGEHTTGKKHVVGAYPLTFRTHKTPVFCCSPICLRCFLSPSYEDTLWKGAAVFPEEDLSSITWVWAMAHIPKDCCLLFSVEQTMRPHPADMLVMRQTHCLY